MVRLVALTVYRPTALVFTGTGIGGSNVAVSL
jgi:hypothetical protein